jgi:pyruvate formate lyase activating enzyme
MLTGLVFNLQRYSIHDGPGIRTTVFFKGCPLSCAWCHNPEGMSPRPELVLADHRCAGCGECRRACPFGASLTGEGALPTQHDRCEVCGACVDACPTGARQSVGRTVSVPEVVREVLKDRVFYESSGGGVTFSGGEPLRQPHFLCASLEACRAHGLHTALDTTGFGCTEHLLAAAALSDLVLYDLKTFDDTRHRTLTGVSNRGIRDNLRALDGVHRNVWIRLPVVPGFNDNLEDFRRLGESIASLRSVTQVNLLPFHRTAAHKWARLGLAYSLDNVQAPSVEFLAQAAELLTRIGLNTRVGGSNRPAPPQPNASP